MRIQTYKQVNPNKMSGYPKTEVPPIYLASLDSEGESENDDQSSEDDPPNNWFVLFEKSSEIFRATTKFEEDKSTVHMDDLNDAISVLKHLEEFMHSLEAFLEAMKNRKLKRSWNIKLNENDKRFIAANSSNSFAILERYKCLKCPNSDCNLCLLKYEKKFRNYLEKFIEAVKSGTKDV